MIRFRPLGAPRLKAAVLAICDRRVRACQAAEQRYADLAEQPNGGILGSVELARRSEATERSARMEAELIRDLIAGLHEAKR